MRTHDKALKKENLQGFYFGRVLLHVFIQQMKFRGRGNKRGEREN